MTGSNDWEVLIEPGLLEEVVQEATRPGEVGERASSFLNAMRRLKINGPSAKGAKKLEDIELHQMRAGRDRIFFIPVNGMIGSSPSGTVPRRSPTISLAGDTSRPHTLSRTGPSECKEGER